MYINKLCFETKLRYCRRRTCSEKLSSNLLEIRLLVGESQNVSATLNEGSLLRNLKIVSAILNEGSSTLSVNLTHVTGRTCALVCRGYFEP